MKVYYVPGIELDLLTRHAGIKLVNRRPSREEFTSGEFAGKKVDIATFQFGLHVVERYVLSNQPIDFTFQHALRRYLVRKRKQVVELLEQPPEPPKSKRRPVMEAVPSSYELVTLGSRPSKVPGAAIVRFQFGPCVKEHRVPVSFPSKEAERIVKRNIRRQMLAFMKNAVKYGRLGFVPLEDERFNSRNALYPPYAGAPPLVQGAR